MKLFPVKIKRVVVEWRLALWLMPIVLSLRPAWGKGLSTPSQPIKSWAWWCVSAVPVTQEATQSRLAWA
jgi:hypothetical protein